MPNKKVECVQGTSDIINSQSVRAETNQASSLSAQGFAEGRLIFKRGRHTSKATQLLSGQAGTGTHLRHPGPSLLSCPTKQAYLLWLQVKKLQESTNKWSLQYSFSSALRTETMD